MKKVLLGSFCALTFFAGTAIGQTQSATAKQSAEATAKAEAGDKAVQAEKPFAGIVQFDHQTVDFGKAKLNKPVTVEFNFTNVGSHPVIIQDAQPSCGCTTPDWTKEPVLPGKKGVIKATYNAATLGSVNKTVFVNFKGISQTLELHLKGTVAR